MSHFLVPPALAVALLIIGAPPTAADCDPAGPLPEVLDRAPVAFIGTVTEAAGPVARFVVTEIWAGSVGPAVEVRGVVDLAPGEAADDDRVWQLGTTYLVVPIVDRGSLRDHVCSATVPWTPELAELRPPTARTFETTVDESASVPWVVVAATALVGIGSVLAFRRRPIRR